MAPQFEQNVIEDGIILIKYFLDVSQDEQEKRFKARSEDPRKHWKLSPMDIESWARWWDYTKAYETMITATDTQHAPWYRVQSDDKRAARLNCISHFLSMIPYEKLPFEMGPFPERRPRGTDIPDEVPSCGARRMADSAALLVDEILPHQPMRQWVLSFPFPLRFLFASNPKAMTGVLGIVYRAISTHLAHKAGFAATSAKSAAVTLIQRFGSALNLNIPQGTLSRCCASIHLVDVETCDKCGGDVRIIASIA